MKNSARRWWAGLAVLFLALILVAPAKAVEIQNGDVVNISGAKVKGPLFASGNTLTINSDVDGDLFCAGQSIIINGAVSGDIIGASNTVQINGPVGGDIRFAANTVAINGAVERSVTTAANTITTGQGSQVKNDLMAFGNTISVNGPVQGQLLGAGNQFGLNSAVGGDVRLWDVQNLNIGPTAVVKGQVNYNSANPAKIAPGAQIGIMNQLEPTAQPSPPMPQIPAAAKRGIDVAGAIWSLAAGFLIWGVSLWLVPRLMPRLGQTAREALWPSLGWGIVTLLLVPVGAIVLMITIIGIPLAFIFMMAYIIVLMVAKVIVSDALARAMTRSYGGSSWVPLIGAFLLLYAVLVILSKIPVAGFFLSLVVACFALGIAVMSLYRIRPGASVSSPAAAAPTLPTVPIEPSRPDATSASAPGQEQ